MTTIELRTPAVKYTITLIFFWGFIAISFILGVGVSSIGPTVKNLAVTSLSFLIK
jgi:hypothetical protein